jgi:putative DNA primase/helicase
MVKPPMDAQFASMPKELLALPQWIGWLSVVGEGRPAGLPNGRSTKVLKKQAKPHKLPIDPTTGGLASTTDPRTWSFFDDASSAAMKWSLTGIGFVFTDSDSYCGVDIDNGRDPETGQIREWAWTIIRSLDSYTEVSPSGTGVHIIVRGTLPHGKGNQAKHHDGKVEMFSRKRYFTFTGIHVDGAQSEILNRQDALLTLHAQLFGRRKSRNAERRSQAPSPPPIDDVDLIAKARSAENGPKFDRLWSGQWEGDYASQSEADLALCCILAFWVQNDAARIDSFFRQSGLMRDKWDREDYRERTINAAVAKTSDTYKPRGRSGSRRPGKAPVTQESGSPTSQPVPDLVRFAHTDIGNAERLVALYGSEIRFCIEMGKWLVWDGRRWVINDSRNVKRLFKKTIREMHQQAADIADAAAREKAEKHARQSEAAMKIRAALECAEHEEGIGISAGELDRHPYLLNCENGTLDLQTGHLGRHERGDLITKLVHCSYRSYATCPRFMRFLYAIMGDNPEAEPTGRAERLVTYLQKCFGYALTGDVSEKVVFCFFGSGNNGKTTLLEIIRFILTEYSAQVLIDTLMAHKSRESSASMADLADLRGARFVTSSEAEEGQMLAVAKLKYLTQGMGDIKACRKYENPIVFTATHKLFLDANHKPIVRGGEKAVWNRLKPVPFLVTIPPEAIDKALLEKLKGEAEGILAWMVEGCRRWLCEGLGDPPEVFKASVTWKAESDRFSAFLEEQYEFDPNGWVSVADAWRSYLAWCDANRERDHMAKTTFDAKLQELGCRKGVREAGTVRVWIGIRRRGEDSTASDKVTASDTKS